MAVTDPKKQKKDTHKPVEMFVFRSMTRISYIKCEKIAQVMLSKEQLRLKKLFNFIDRLVNQIE